MKTVFLRLVLIPLCLSFQHLFSYYEGSPLFEHSVTSRLDIIAKFIPETPMIFEAGAHYGFDTLRFSNKWPHSTIIAFEPLPHSFERFKAATRHLSNAAGYQLALNDEKGSSVFYVCGAPGKDSMWTLGESSLLENNGWSYAEGAKITVSCVILDDWCKENGVSSIDFLSLDLEGAELKALQSSPDILETIKVIHVATFFKEMRKGMTRYVDLKRFLEEAGFVVLAHWYSDEKGAAIFIKEGQFSKLLPDKDSLPAPYNTAEIFPFDPRNHFGNRQRNGLRTVFQNADIHTVIEVGSYLGASTRFIAQMLPQDGKIYAVDHWLCDLGNDSKYYELFLSNVIHANLCTKIVPVRMDSLKAASVMADQVDLVFIDGSHDYESVYQDLTAWHKHVKEGGILCGDDYNGGDFSRPVKRAVDRFAEENGFEVVLVDEWFWYYKTRKQPEVDPDFLPVLPRENRENMTTSVIIPCIPLHVQYLSSLLESYKNQSIPPDEVVISLSEAQDVHSDRLKQLEEQERPFPVTILRNFEKLSAGSNRNRAFDTSSGDIIICQDADDIPHNRRVEVIKFFFENYYVDHLMHSYISDTPGLGIYGEFFEFAKYDIDEIEALRPTSYRAARHLQDCEMHNGNAAFARYVLKKYRWSPTFQIGEDVEMNEEIYKEFVNTVIIKVPLLHYRRGYSSFLN